MAFGFQRRAEVWKRQNSAKKSKGRQRMARAVAEAMEERVLLSAISVNSGAEGTNYASSVTISQLNPNTTAVTLRDAIDAANNTGGTNTISFASALGGTTISLSTTGDNTFGQSAFIIRSNLTIDGGSGGITIARDMVNTPGNLRLFYITSAGNLTLKNMTLSGGQSYGGSGDQAGGGAGLGGAIVNAGSLTLIADTLANNSAYGGGENLTGAEYGGGGLDGGFTGLNGGGPNGGAQSSEYGGTGGFGGGGGQGLFAGSGGFGGGGGGSSNNYVGGRGGFGGGGGHSDYNNPGGFGAGSSGGGGAGMGGAIFNYGGSITLVNSTLADNIAVGGRGINPAANGLGLGGAIFNLNGSVTSTNSTLAYNSASYDGGAIYSLGDNGIATQSGPTLPANIATVTLNNSILADSIYALSDFVQNINASDGSHPGSVASSGSNNIIQTVEPGYIAFAGSAENVDPQLAAGLASNGGPTQTIALLVGSPAVNAGNNSLAIYNGSTLATDQRGAGYERMADAVDIGAYEVQPPVVTESSSNLDAPVTSIVINGSGFDTIAANDSVVLNDGAAGVVTAATTTQLTVSLSQAPTAGALTAVVTTDGVDSGSPVEVANIITVPVIASSQVVQTTNSIAVFDFHVAASGGATITKCGVLYAPASAQATLELNNAGVTEIDMTPGVLYYSIGVSGLSSLTGYDLVAFSVNSVGVTYSPISTCTTTSIVVNTLGDPASPTSGMETLRKAVATADSAGGNQVITFAPSLAGDTIGLSITGDNTFGQSALLVTGNVTIDGGSSGITLARDTTNAPGNLRAFYITSAGSLTLKNLTLEDWLSEGGSGKGAGGGAGLGGAIVNAGSLTLIGDTLADNDAIGGGENSGQFAPGGGGLDGGITNSLGNGGGPNGGSVPPWYNILAAGNGGFGGGGGSTANFVVGGSGGFGGGGGTGNGGYGGAGGFGGGGAYGSDASALGGFGGGNDGGGGAGLGGAVFNYGGSITLVNSTFAYDLAAGGAGASPGTNGQGLGGAIFNLNGSVTAINSTLAYNTAVQGAGDIYSLGDDGVATQGGPALPSTTATVTLNNSILADSIGNDYVQNINASDGIHFGTVSSSGSNNIIQTPGYGAQNFSGSASNVDPQLFPSLESNGGPTQTFAISFGSPAIQAGNNSLATYGGSPLSTDQRGAGYQRIAGTNVDVGAYELQPIVNSNTAPLVNTATTLTLAGSGFDANGANDSVMFNNGVTGTVTLANSGALVVTFNSPLPLGPLTAVVVADGLSSISAEVANVIALPTIVSPSTWNITNNTATLTFNITAAGSSPVTNCGVLYAPASADASLMLGGAGVTEVDDSNPGTGAFIEPIAGLSGSTSYDFVAFAQSSYGVTYAPINTFTTTSIVVNTLGDPSTPTEGVLSLREAIAIGESEAGNQTITFDPSLTNSSFGTIDLSSELELDDTNGTLTISGPGSSLLWIDNTADFGRAFEVAANSSAVIQGVTIADGEINLGGAILADNGSTLSVDNSTLTENHASSGGAIFFSGATLTLSGDDIIQNYATNGAGIFALGPGNVDVSNSTIELNGGNLTLQGGGIYVSGPSLAVSDTSILENTATVFDSDGGGIFYMGTNFKLLDSTVADNSAYDAGGIYADFGFVSVNSTIAGNSIISPGGGVAGVYCIGTAYLANTLDADVSDLYMNDNSADNLFVAGSTINLSGFDGNIIERSVSTFELGTPGSYGGDVPTIPLLPGSAAIDAGANSIATQYGLTTDERGMSRVVNGTVDIGAFESSGFTVSITEGNNQTADADSAFGEPLAVSVTSGDPNLTDLGGGVVTITAPSSGASAVLSSSSVTLDDNGDAEVSATANDTGGTYSVSASGAGISSPATFDLANYSSAPVVTLDPVSQTIGALSTIAISATAIGIPAPSVQWQYSTDGGQTFSTIPGDNFDSFFYTATAPASGYEFEAVFSNSAGSVTTAPATLTILPLAPTITVADSGGVYTGNPYTATAQLKRVDGTLVSTIEDGVYPSIAYYSGDSAQGTPLLAAPVDPGTYTVEATYPGSTNYTAGASDPVTFTIAPATPVVQASAAGGAYTGQPFAGSATVQGVSGGPGSTLAGIAPTLIYYAGTSASGTPLAGAPTNVGTYTLAATFPGSVDYSSAENDIVFTITADSLNSAAAVGGAQVFGYANAIADLGGAVISDGGETITSRGILLAPADSGATLTLDSPGVTEADDPAQGVGTYDELFTHLNSNTQYNFVAFATNGLGTSYSGVGSFTTTNLVVNTLSDPTTSNDGVLSLREAIARASSDGGNQTITFDPRLTSGGPATIVVTGSPIVLNDTVGMLTISGPGPNLLTIFASNEDRALEVAGSTTAQISGVTISGADLGANTPDGGIVCDATSTVTVSSCNFVGNYAADGGAIEANNCTLILNDDFFTGNQATEGGAIYAGPSTEVTINGGMLFGNSADSIGGALFIVEGAMYVSDCTVNDNTALGAEASGGGIYADQTPLFLSNSTIAENSSDGAGGIWCNDILTANNCTIAGNTTTSITMPTDAGGLLGDTTELANTIVADPSTVNMSALYNFNNLFGPGTDLGAAAGVNGNVTEPSVAALGLGMLGGYGGDVSTIPLLPGSPAIDAGSNYTVTHYDTPTDERGWPRVVNAFVDIGAFESSGFTINVTGGDPQTTNILSAFAVPLAVHVTANDPNLTNLTGGVVTLTPPGSGASASFSSNSITLDSNGDGSAITTANAIAGDFTVTASVQGASPAYFSLTNVSAPPSVTLDPQSQTVVALTTVTLMAAASGIPAPTVQWQLSTDGGNTFNDIVGQTNASLSVRPTAAQNGDQYRAVFTNAVGTADSAPATLTVHQAATSVTVTDRSGVYSGNPFYPFSEIFVTGTFASFLALEGVGPAFTYYAGTMPQGTPLPGAPVDPGTYTVIASFAGSADYAASGVAATTFTIMPAQPTIQVTAAGGVYSGQPFAATATIQGVSGTPAATLQSVAPTLTYFSGPAAVGTALSAPPTDAGTYTVIATFPGNADYASAQSTATFAISKAAPELVFNDSNVLYDGSAHAASATATGVEPTPADLSSLLQLSYQNTATGQVSSTPPVAPGTYQVLASFSGNADYASVSQVDTGKTVNIGPISTAAVVNTLFHSSRTIFTGTLVTTPVKGKKIMVTIAGVTMPARIGRGGAFKINFPTSNLAAGTYNVTFSYTPSARAGTMTASSTLIVGYKLKAKYSPTQAYAAGSTIPIIFQLLERVHSICSV